MQREKKVYTTEIGGKKLEIEISSLAEQANAAVLIKYGDTVALVTTVMTKSESTANYLPLKVDYEERFYAAGKILGSRFTRREGKSSEEAVLAGRLVDRTIRPLFDERIRRDIQVVVTILSYDEQNDPGFLGLIGASTALSISDIPWNGPAAGVCVAKIDGKFVVNPTNAELAALGVTFEAFVAGPKDRINMIELSGLEAQEADILDAFALAQEEINKLIAFQEKIRSEIGKPKEQVPLFEAAPDLRSAIHEFLNPRIEEALYQSQKMEQSERLRVLQGELYAHLGGAFPDYDKKAADFVWEEYINELVHKNILENDRRPDGRGVTDIRPLHAEVKLFDRTHGSALFQRGNTQALAVTTLAAPGQEQLIESMETNGKKRFLLHYNFPAYSVGEIGNFRGPGRREIGHGALAEKALRPLIPAMEDFPYTIRVVSEILSSNGSSSMATVCASTLSLMDAGVPLKKPAAGIAMGLMMNESGDKFKVLTDLQGPEDHWGDMDFKVAGTTEGVNAVQLDVKVHGLTMAIVKQTLSQAKDARLKILEVMAKAIPQPRAEISKFAPAIERIKINPEKIGIVIGPGGKMINGLIDRLKLVAIDIDDDGSVYVAADSMAKVKEAVQEIRLLTREFTMGEIVDGRVVKIMDFGAIVDLGGGADGMIHVSELREGFVKNVEEVLHMGDFVRAKIIRLEDGRIGLSIKQMTPEEGKK